MLPADHVADEMCCWCASLRQVCRVEWLNERNPLHTSCPIIHQKIGVEVDDLFNGYIIHHQYVLCPLQWWARSESMNIYSLSNMGKPWSVGQLLASTHRQTSTHTHTHVLMIVVFQHLVLKRCSAIDTHYVAVALRWIWPTGGWDRWTNRCLIKNQEDALTCAPLWLSLNNLRCKGWKGSWIKCGELSLLDQCMG